MPPAIPRPCAHPTCPVLVTGSSRCATHRRAKEADDRRHYGSADERGYDARWRKYRTSYLAMNPLCAACLKQGRTAAAVELDHIVPRAAKPSLFWERTNHQGLCKACHRAKTADERRRGL